MVNLLFSLLTVGTLHASPAFEFDLVADGVETRLPANVETQWTQGDVPSCQVFQLRKKHLLKEAEELDGLLAKYERQREALSRRQLEEIRQLHGRRMNLERELKGHRLQLTATIDLPEDGVNRDWLLTRNYRLIALTPDLDWRGLDSSEPDGLTLNIEPGKIQVKSWAYLSAMCAGPGHFSIQLVKRS